jgi:hypothetical protein
VPTVPGSGPTTVSSWWRGAFGTSRGVETRNEEYLSNRFRVLAAPEHLYVLDCAPGVLDDGPAPWDLRFPAARLGNAFLTFAGPDALAEDGVSVRGTEEVELVSLRTTGLPTRGVDAHEGHRLVSQLFRVAWERKANALGLRRHQLASRRSAWCFTKRSQEQKRKVFFRGSDGKQHWRVVVGRTHGHWYHFGLSASVMFDPYAAFAMQPHVVFSDDGGRPWDSADRLARARRSACKNWWNDTWRDRMCATVQFLAQGETAIRLAVGAGVEILVASAPESFLSPVSYSDAAFEEVPSTEDGDEVVEGEDE